MIDEYILGVDNEPIETPFMKAWIWREKNPDKVYFGCSYIHNTHISTVFLTLDHGWGVGEPVLFETMIFNHPFLDCSQWRYRTHDEAVDGHFEICELVRKTKPILKPDVTWRRCKIWVAKNTSLTLNKGRQKEGRGYYSKKPPVKTESALTHLTLAKK